MTEPTSSYGVPEGLVDSLLTQDLPVPDVPLPEAVTSSSFAPTDRKAPRDDRWWGHHLAELRWQAELARLLVSPVWYGVGVPRGNGQPVLLIPGFLAGDESLAPMANWMSRMGHKPYGSGMHLNVDCSDRAVSRIERRLEKVVDQHGRKAALVGHSRGGHFSKALAHRRPDLVEQVISMGSGLDEPFDISIPTKAAVAAVRTVLQSTSIRAAKNGCLTDTCDCPFVRDYSAPFPSEQVPLTSIFTRGDGVVRWRACAVPYARNVEISGSHIGLAFNRRAYRVIGLLLGGKADEVRTVPAYDGPTDEERARSSGGF
ncbi:MAG: alpha/beta hydrolase [Actinomycetota bacterium]|nr:alpha/beta hydrolase [Actinomycetota bacterium]